MCNRRIVALNCFSLAFFFVIAPAICIAHAFIPLSAFVSLLCTICLHGRAPYWHRAARCFARIVSSGWAAHRVHVEGVTENVGQTRCFVAVPSHFGFRLSPVAGFNERLLSWAIVLLATDEWTKPLHAVTELPATCNAPGMRLLFQFSGFIDYRAASVFQFIDRGHDLLFFDKALAEMHARKSSPKSEIRLVTLKVTSGYQ